MSATPRRLRMPGEPPYKEPTKIQQIFAGILLGLIVALPYAIVEASLLGIWYVLHEAGY